MEKNRDLIEEKLEDAGYELGKISPSGNSVEKISKTGGNVAYDSASLFDNFIDQHFSLVTYHTILYLSATKGDFVMLEDLRQYLQARIEDGHVQSLCKECPVTTFKCPNCQGFEFEQIRSSEGQIRRCSNGCGDFSKDELEEHDYWESIGARDIFQIVKNIEETGFLGTVYLKKCHNCGNEFETVEREGKIDVECENCGRNSDLLTSIYARDLDLANPQGSWFEWFCYKLIIDKCDPEAYCLPRMVIKDDVPTETDGLFVIDGDLVVIDCKAKNIKKNLSRDEVPQQMIEWQNFADSIGVISTSKISKPGTNMYSGNVDAKVHFIEQDQIWDIPEIIA